MLGVGVYLWKPPPHTYHGYFGYFNHLGPCGNAFHSFIHSDLGSWTHARLLLLTRAGGS